MSSEISWRDLACTQCGAPVNQRCWVGGKWCKQPHNARLVAAVLASMPSPPQLGYSEKAGLHIVSGSDGKTALCGAVLDSVPLLQPPLVDGCSNCLRRLVSTTPATEPQTIGVCPECGAEETLEDGRLPAHRKLVQRRHGIERSGEWCDGKGMLPEATS